MNNTLQLYVDDEKTIKGYPVTSPDRVIDENGKSVKDKLKNNVKFDVVGQGVGAPPIDGGNAELVEKVDKLEELVDGIESKITIPSEIYLSKANTDIFKNIPNNSIVIIDKDITLTSTCSLAGKSNITILSKNNSTITLESNGFEISGTNNISFNNLKVIGNNKVFVTNSNGRADSIIIDNCHINNVASAFSSHGVSNLRIMHSKINDTTNDAIDVLNEPFNIEICDNIITNVKGIGIKLYCSSSEDSYNIKVNNNYINNISKGTQGYGMGIEIHEGFYDVECNNNIINNGTCMGISLSGVKKAVCCGNKIENIIKGYGTGIEIVRAVDCCINNNVIIKTSQHGIILDKVDNCQIVGNNIKQEIRDSWSDENFCITIGGGTTEKNDCLIANNKLIGGTYGVVLKDNIVNLKIDGNIIEKSFAKSISNHAATNTKKNIFITNNTLQNITIKNGTGYNINNNIFNNFNIVSNATAIDITSNVDGCIISSNLAYNFNRFIYIANIEVTDRISKPKKLYICNNIGYDVRSFILNDDSEHVRPISQNNHFE